MSAIENLVCIGVDIALLIVFAKDQAARRRTGQDTAMLAGIGIGGDGKPIGVGTMMTAMIPGLILIAGVGAILFGVMNIAWR